LQLQCSVKRAIKNQLELVFIALSFYSRLPVPKWLEYSPQKLKDCGAYLPLVGAVLCLIYTASLYGLLALFSPEIAVALSLALLIWLTGSFHEDGFADFCDGFGGGYQKEQILTIMVDSRIGTYGAVGLVLSLLLRYLTVAHLVALNGIVELASYLLVAFTFSRFMAYSYILDLEYVRIATQDAITKNKSSFMTQKNNRMRTLLHAALFGVTPLLLLSWEQALTIICVLLVIRTLFGRYLVSKIGGYTGDCLGAAQQIFELSIYLILGAQFGGALVWSYI